MNTHRASRGHACAPPQVGSAPATVIVRFLLASAMGPPDRMRGLGLRDTPSGVVIDENVSPMAASRLSTRLPGICKETDQRAELCTTLEAPTIVKAKEVKGCVTHDTDVLANA